MIYNVNSHQNIRYPYLYVIIAIFLSVDICRNEDNLLKAQDSGDSKRVRWWLETIWKRLKTLDKKAEFECVEAFNKEGDYCGI